ncbi:MAG: GxxExxY protein [Syntrophaceticus sp.]|nr:GxxExxY protein [Syntrophaceticus sp.]MDD4360172.1 GxxExxY protein [Syntrophaceticus sp.]MDD4782709.1 GxxExxY protein [Syntrophaceticus sp.]
MKKKNEVAHYPEITRHIEAQVNSNFRARGINNASIYWKSGELTSKIKELIAEHPEKCTCLQTYCRITPPLNLDIFGVITDGVHFEIVILEVKLRKTVGLSEWSQLLGYCLISNTKYGLLININAGASSRLTEILTSRADVSRIIRIRENGDEIEHLFGFMQWNTLTQNFEYSNLGQLSALSALCNILIDKFK